MYSFNRHVRHGLGWADPGPTPTNPEERTDLMGSVTNPTGSINGVSFADLTDCFAHKSGAAGTWQDLLLLSNVHADPDGQYGDAGARYLANQVVKSEKWLTLVMAASRVDGNALAPLGPPPLGVRFLHDQAQTHGDGYYELNALAYIYSNTCGQKTYAVGGWVEYSRYDGDDVPEADRRVEGSYDLTRGTEQVTGAFSAPRVYGTSGSGKPACLSP